MREFVLCLLLLFFVSGSFAAPAAIQLNDGTQVVGNITSYIDGIYTIETLTLGSVQVREGQINAILYQGSHSEPGASSTQSQETSGNASTAGSIQILQNAMMGNKELFAMIQALAGDPQLQAILSDPEIMRAVSTGDTQTLANNEKFMRLMDHPEIRRITSKVPGVK
jgi:hypothetical protein